MRGFIFNAIFLIASSALSAGATAQEVYKCGDTYSQAPCPGGVVIDTTDQRTQAQKTQADLVTGRNARTAAAMEQARLQQEKRDLAANTATLAPRAASAKPASAGTTAQAPGEKKKSKSKKTPIKNATKL
jgi:hypothetical protein